MFDLKKKKQTLLKDKTVQKEKDKKGREQEGVFDEWIKRHKKIILKDNKKEIKNIYWFKEFQNFIEKGGRVKVFLDSKNAKLYTEFKENYFEKIMSKNEDLKEEIARCEKVISNTVELEYGLLKFAKDIKKLEYIFTKKRFDDVKNLLIYYSQTGVFDEKYLEKLREKIKGFWNTVFNWFRMYRARRFLDKFVLRYTENNVFNKANEIFFMHYGKDVGYTMSLRINTICMFDEMTTKIWIKKKEKAISKINKMIKNMAKTIQKNDEFLREVEKSFKNTKLLKIEEDIVLRYLEDKGV